MLRPPARAVAVEGKAVLRVAVCARGGAEVTVADFVPRAAAGERGTEARCAQAAGRAMEAVPNRVMAESVMAIRGGKHAPDPTTAGSAVADVSGKVAMETTVAGTVDVFGRVIATRITA